MMHRPSALQGIVAAALALVATTPLNAQTPLTARDETVLALDHYVPVKSMVPGFEGQAMQVYVRERVLPGIASRGAAARGVVVFVHGSGTPSEVSFDISYQDYSWMAYLARAGFDVFSVDMTGYGRSTRPAPMNDPCNLPPATQAMLGAILAAPCTANYRFSMTTAASDWNDLGAAVDYVMRLRHVEKVSIFGWSAGGPRAGGYAAQHPEKVANLVLLAPSYGRTGSATAPATLPAPGSPYGTQTYEAFMANWDRQAPCANQYDPAMGPAIWKEMLESDPVGATWGTGMRRAPNSTSWGWNQAVVSQVKIPTLLISGVHDGQVNPTGVRTLLEDLGSESKVFVDLACSSHGAMWERNHLLLFKASLDWLTSGAVNGTKNGVVQLGYPTTATPTAAPARAVPGPF